MTDTDIRKRHFQDEVAFVEQTNHGWGYRHAHHDRMVLLDEVDRLLAEVERLKRIIAGMT